MIQIEPAKCRGKLKQGMWDDTSYGAEFKFHGCRYLNYEGSTFLSRHISVKGGYVDKSLSLPHLMVPELKGTILDGEIILKLYGTVRDVTSILGSSPELALLKQRERGVLQYMVFDIPFHSKTDLREKPYYERKSILRKVLKELDNEHYHYVDFKIAGKRLFYDAIVQKGGEGIILKQLQSKYGERSKWIKVKKEETWDVFITGFLDPSEESEKVDGSISVTRYAEKNWIGSIEIALMKGGEVYACGSVSGIGEELRERISRDPKKYIGQVIEIRAQSQLESGKFEHPRFLRFRDDKSAEECIYAE